MHKIRPATVADIALIRELTFQVWPQTYASILSPEQLDYMLDMMYSEKSLLRQMSEGSRFELIYAEEVPVGFAAWFPYQDDVYKLDKIYVLPAVQGKGTGQYLLNHVLEQVKSKGGRALRLNVNRHNKARGFYERQGFAVIGEGDFDIGQGYFMNDYIMEKKIAP